MVKFSTNINSMLPMFLIFHSFVFLLVGGARNTISLADARKIVLSTLNSLTCRSKSFDDQQVEVVCAVRIWYLVNNPKILERHRSQLSGLCGTLLINKLNRKKFYRQYKEQPNRYKKMMKWVKTHSTSNDVSKALMKGLQKTICKAQDPRTMSDSNSKAATERKSVSDGPSPKKEQLDRCMICFDDEKELSEEDRKLITVPCSKNPSSCAGSKICSRCLKEGIDKLNKIDHQNVFVGEVFDYVAHDGSLQPCLIRRMNYTDDCDVVLINVKDQGRGVRITHVKFTELRRKSLVTVNNFKCLLCDRRDVNYKKRDFQRRMVAGMKEAYHKNRIYNQVITFEKYRELTDFKARTDLLNEKIEQLQAQLNCIGRRDRELLRENHRLQQELLRIRERSTYTNDFDRERLGGASVNSDYTSSLETYASTLMGTVNTDFSSLDSDDSRGSGIE